MSRLKSQGIDDAQRAREELYDTFAQLRDRLDYAQRIDDSVERAKVRIAEEKEENPLGFAIGVAAVAGAVGVVAWGIARAVIRRLG